MPNNERGPEPQDPLYLTTVYPDATAVFSFAPRPLAGVFSEAIFALDTNALLVPYGTDPASLSEIHKTYKTLAAQKRLVIPGQAAREFGKNRPEHLRTMYDQLARRYGTNVPPASYPLLSNLPEYAALQAAERELSAQFEKYRTALKKLMNTVRGWYWDDPVSTIYRAIFTSDVIVDPEIDGAQIKHELAFRNSHKVPPGYKDAGKELGASGDLLIWKAILEVGARRKKDVLFVSGEEKSDWWYRTQEGALYPRYELLDEFRRASDGRTFHIIRLAELLRQFGANPEVVEDVREQELIVGDEITGDGSSRARHALVEDAVARWLSRRGMVKRDEKDHIFLESKGGARVRIRILLMGGVGLPSMWLKDRLDRWLVRVRSEAPGSEILVLVTSSSAAVRALTRRASAHLELRPDQALDNEIVFGFLEGTAFYPFARRLHGQTTLVLESQDDVALDLGFDLATE